MRNKKIELTIARAKRTRLGRVICKTLGDRTGAVMMEYVILAVLIAAAAVVAVAVFGGAIVDMFDVAGKAATGNASGASSARQQAAQTQIEGDAVAVEYQETMIE